MLASLVLADATTAPAAVKLALPFTDRMVLQRAMPVPIWGTAAPGERVTVTFAQQAQSTVANARGEWRVTLEPLEMNVTGTTLTAQASNTVDLSDVLVGEVWLGAGQSNMEATMDRLRRSSMPSPAAKAEANARFDRAQSEAIPGIRLLRLSRDPNDTGKGVWLECDGDALRTHENPRRAGFSATAYFFARRLQAELGMPVGMIQLAVGGSIIESWTGGAADGGRPAGRNFASLVQPLTPLAMRGVIWYQGESNVITSNDGLAYADKMAVMIESWRKAWARADLPFYYVQLPRFEYSRRYPDARLSVESLPWLREAQTVAQRIPHTGMAVTIDLVDVFDIHPANKWDIGERLARLALARTYGRTDIVASGPVYRTLQRRGREIVLRFDHPHGGLVSSDAAPLHDFTIAGVDRRFVTAQAVIEGDTVVVGSPEVPEPVAVRFGWHERARPNLFNGAGLPAGPFRTDDWPAPAAVK